MKKDFHMRTPKIIMASRTMVETEVLSHDNLTAEDKA